MEERVPHVTDHLYREGIGKLERWRELYFPPSAGAELQNLEE